MRSSPGFRSGKDPYKPCWFDALETGELLVLSGAVAALEIKTITDDAFQNQVIGRAGKSYAESEINFQLRREIKVDGGKNLVLLLMNRGESVAGPNEP